MYLLDTNIWLERLLEQDQAEEVKGFLSNILPSKLNLTDFALHSIGLALVRLKKHNLLFQFITDVLIDHPVTVVRLDVGDYPGLLHSIEKYHLNYDDAYHYFSARKINAQLISFDSDFDRTDRGRMTPAEVLDKLQNK